MTRSPDRLKPSLTALVFGLWILVVPTLAGGRLLNADGDLPRHLRHGAEMMRTGHLIRADVFSYTRAGQPFVGFEYLSQLALTGAYRLAGLAGVAVLAALLIAAAYTLVLRFLLRRGVDPLLAYSTILVAAAVGSIHWAARPHLFTLVGVALLLPLLEPERARPVWQAPLLAVPVFALWANLHGGFLYGLVLIALFFVGDMLEWLSGDRAAPPRAGARVALGFAGLVGTLITPFGLGLYRHLIAFFGDHYLRDHTQEFFSPDFHTLSGKILLLLLLVVLTAFTLIRTRPGYARLIVILANVGFALTALRNVPLFALIALPLLALHADRAWRTLPDPGGVRAVFQRDAALGSTGSWIAGLTAAMVALSLAGGRLGAVQLVPDRFDPKVFPVSAVSAARAANLPGPVFHEFTWGGYLLAAWPERRVFIDGGTDFYGSELMRTHIAIVGVEPGWRERLERWQVRTAVLATGRPLTLELAREPGWTIWRTDSIATVVVRSAPSLAVR